MTLSWSRHYVGSRVWLAGDVYWNSLQCAETVSTGDAVEWFQRFELCSKANGWTEEIKTAKLPAFLEGEALATWLELDKEERKEYEKVKEKMVEILMPTGFVTFDQFHQRKLMPGESLSVFIHDMKNMQCRTSMERRESFLHPFMLRWTVFLLEGHGKW